jgi:ribosomal protein S18 acetylase RimI-like enzyme
MQTKDFDIRAVQESDREWVCTLLREHWGAIVVVSRGRVHRGDLLPGFIAVRGKERVGLATYHMEGRQCELVTLNSFGEGMGVGSALLSRVRDAAAEAGCKRFWLITTNDNTNALRFYQKRGLRLVALHVNALEQSRRLKPEIPEFGMDGIPLRDEIELEMALDG